MKKELEVSNQWVLKEEIAKPRIYSRKAELLIISIANQAHKPKIFISNQSLMEFCKSGNFKKNTIISGLLDLVDVKYKIAGMKYYPYTRISKSRSGYEVTINRNVFPHLNKVAGFIQRFDLN